MIRFSVLIPVYNKEKPEYFKQTLQSAIKQTVKPSEIVIVKDGILSNEIENVIKDFINCNKIKIKIIPLEKNIGTGGALAIGVRECSYDYIARLDSDDIALNNRFELQTLFFEKNPEIDIISGYIEEFNESSNKKNYIRKVPITDVKIKKYIKYRSPFNHSAVMYKKESILKIGNYSNLRKMEDYDLWIRAVKNNLKLYNIPEVLLKVRVDDSTYKKRGGFKYIRTILYIQRQLKMNGIITTLEQIRNVLIRAVVAIMPDELRKYIYLNFLRREKSNERKYNSDNECIQ